jgi:DNA-binding NtrC family response regulator
MKKVRGLGRNFVYSRPNQSAEHLFGTAVASLWDMAYATYKSVAITPVQSSLTPCIFDDDPNERDSLAHLITDMGYEPVSTADAEEALRLVRMGRCRVVFASTHLENPDPFDFLDRALRCDPGACVMIMTSQHTLEGALEAIRRGAADFPVSQQRLAVCNCSAMVDTLLESQLFGHVRGAFTGATDTRPGLFEYANGGTVFSTKSVKLLCRCRRNYCA